MKLRNRILYIILCVVLLITGFLIGRFVLNNIGSAGTDKSGQLETPADENDVLDKAQITVAIPTATPEPALTPEPTEIPLPTATPEPTSEPTPIVEAEPVILSKYNELLLTNTDVCGYISIPDTRVDYPVLYDSGSDYKYLKTAIDNTASKSGCICLKYTNYTCRSEFARNTLIFGHNMKAGTMFADVVKYKDEDFYNAHKYIYFDNLYEEEVWKVFSVYVLNADNETIETRFESDTAFTDYLESVKQRSMFFDEETEAVEFTAEDKIITLSTCSYEYSNGRTIVHAVKLKPEEMTDSVRPR